MHHLRPQLQGLEKAIDALEQNKPVRSIDFTEDEYTRIRNLNLLTAKPVRCRCLFQANCLSALDGRQGCLLSLDLQPHIDYAMSPLMKRGSPT